MEGTPSITLTVSLISGMLGGIVNEVILTLRTEDGTAVCKF